MLEVNASAACLDAVVAVLPSMRQATVSRLFGDTGYAVKAAVPRDLLPQVIPAVKAAAAPTSSSPRSRRSCHERTPLNSNEGPRAPQALLAELAALDPEVLRRYPDATAVETALAVRVGVRPERVVVTAGADEALDRICRVYAGPIARCCYPSRPSTCWSASLPSPVRRSCACPGSRMRSPRRDPRTPRPPHRSRDHRVAQQSDRRRRIAG